MPTHPVSDLLGIKSNRLSGKKIVLGITGSIAAVETVKLTHELVRHGAEVYPVLSEAACKIISPDALQYASGKKPIIKLTGDVEHVSLCGQVKDHADLLLIAPCTANTISKIACGIDDTTVTTFATTAIGSKIPIIIVPAMHSSMFEHSIIQENIMKLEKHKLNIEIIHPVKAENKWKLPSIDEIVSRVTRTLWKQDLNGKSVLIIAGTTAEPIDDIRILTNRSSGNTGLALSNIAYLRGAEVVLWLGKSFVTSNNWIHTEYFETVNDLKKKVQSLKKVGNRRGARGFDVIIVCAAISDYSTSKPFKGKLPSGKGKLKLELVQTPKIIKIIREQNPNSYIVGFKAEANLSENKLIDKAFNRMTEWKLNMIIANDIKKVKKDKSEILIIYPSKKSKKVKGNKEYLAERIFDEIRDHI